MKGNGQAAYSLRGKTNATASLSGKTNGTASIPIKIDEGNSLSGRTVETESLSGKTGGESSLNGDMSYGGDSAYEIAVKNGFEGSEAEWLESLKGEDGTSVTHSWDGEILIINSASGTSSIDLTEKINIAVDSSVPKELDILPQATSEQFGTSELRDMTRVFVDANGVAHYATLEQLKQLNTKTVCVDTLTDDKIKTLSNGDIVLLKEG